MCADKVRGRCEDLGVPQGSSEEFIWLDIVDIDEVGRALSFELGWRHLGCRKL
jgi:hypothetical protein